MNCGVWPSKKRCFIASRCRWICFTIVRSLSRRQQKIPWKMTHSGTHWLQLDILPAINGEDSQADVYPPYGGLTLLSYVSAWRSCPLPVAAIFLAAFTSRSKLRLQYGQLCTRVARDFGTFSPQPEQFWLVFFGFTLTTSLSASAAL